MKYTMYHFLYFEPRATNLPKQIIKFDTTKSEPITKNIEWFYVSGSDIRIKVNVVKYSRFATNSNLNRPLDKVISINCSNSPLLPSKCKRIF